MHNGNSESNTYSRPLPRCLVELVQQVISLASLVQLLGLILKYKASHVCLNVSEFVVKGLTSIPSWTASTASLASGSWMLWASRTALAARALPMFPRQTAATSSRWVFTHILAMFSHTDSLYKIRAGYFEQKVLASVHKNTSLTIPLLLCDCECTF